MIQDIQPLDRTLSTFLANTEYGIWQYHRTQFTRFPFGYGLRRPLADDDFIFEQKKARLEEKIENLSYLGLVNSHLFPHYDEYENAISRYLDSILNNMWGEPVMIPKSRAYPMGGRYFLADLKLTEGLFDNIPNRFFNRFECGVQVIGTVQCEDMFWQNLDLHFDRKETLCSWNGHRFGRISGETTVVVPEMNESCKGAIIPAVMALLLRSWTEACRLRENPLYRWAGTALGRGRYRKNIDDLMAGSSNSCLMGIGLFLKSVQDVSRLVSKPEEISATDEKPLCSGMPPVSAVEHATRILKQSEGYRHLLELEEVLCRVADGLDALDQKTACEIWNRCAKQKARSMEEIRALLASKYTGVRDDILTILSMRPVYHKNISFEERLFRASRI